jgi:hypothetical protein
MIEFLWQFSNLRVQAQQNDLADVMVSVKYRLCATDRYRSVYRYGDVDFAPADPENFTSISRVTEQSMIAFVEQTLADDLDTLKAEMLAEHSASPVDDRPLPWLNATNSGDYTED